MKKTYIIPTTLIVMIQTNRIMAGSIAYGQTTTATSGNLSRRGGSDWDDDDDYYEEVKTKTVP